jgi:hypothetical protein
MVRTLLLSGLVLIFLAHPVRGEAPQVQDLDYQEVKDSRYFRLVLSPPADLRFPDLSPRSYPCTFRLGAGASLRHKLATLPRLLPVGKQGGAVYYLPRALTPDREAPLEAPLEPSAPGRCPSLWNTTPSA